MSSRSATKILGTPISRHEKGSSRRWTLCFIVENATIGKLADVDPAPEEGKAGKRATSLRLQSRHESWKLRAAPTWTHGTPVRVTLDGKSHLLAVGTATVSVTRYPMQASCTRHDTQALAACAAGEWQQAEADLLNMLEPHEWAG